MAAVGTQHARRDVGLREGKAALLEFGAERRVGRRGDEQHERRRHHVMDEAWLRNGLRPDAAPDPVVALEQQDLAALQAQHGGADQAVDAASHDDVIRFGHGTSLILRRMVGTAYGNASL